MHLLLGHKKAKPGEAYFLERSKLKKHQGDEILNLLFFKYCNYNYYVIMIDSKKIMKEEEKKEK